MRRLLVSTTGWLVLVVGVILFPLPGPGLLLMAAGLAILARQHAWAARLVDRVLLSALVGAARGVVTLPRAVWSFAATSALTASGLLWLWAPPAPRWWTADLPGWLWLPGGVWSGVGQILSGLVTLALVAYSFRRFHGRPDAIAELARRNDRVPPVGRV